MMIHLSKELQQFVHEAVRAGRHASENEVIRDALDRLRNESSSPGPSFTAASKPEEVGSVGRAAHGVRPSRRTKAAGKRAAKNAFHHRLIEIGLMSRLPNVAADVDEPEDRLIVIEGESLSNTVIRERR